MAEPCTICRGVGFVTLDVEPGDRRFGQAVPCACTLATRRAEQVAALNRGKWAPMTLDSFVPLTDTERATHNLARLIARNWAANVTDGLVLWAAKANATQTFEGQPGHVTGCGCGKTHLAVSLAKAALNLGHTVKIVTEGDLFGAIKASYKPDAVLSQDGIIADLGEPWLLVYDDLGTEWVKPESLGWYQDVLFQLFDARYTASLPVIITTNLTPADLGERVGPRVTSRLQEMTAFSRLNGPDRREMAR